MLSDDEPARPARAVPSIATIIRPLIELLKIGFQPWASPCDQLAFRAARVAWELSASLTCAVPLVRRVPWRLAGRLAHK